MTKKLALMAVLALVLSACAQPVPVERKNNCACDWEQLPKPQIKGDVV